ncbi:katanin p80 WD40 repeat-containing subunit B1 homolog isoform X2 [Helianthus annuus]|uniref:katanin p80 WD40 repeat-containing subunit B1 homolog isoform X2 n=1 Tax=Helianthus annuus TaxID=4232 RepID=UPI000B8FFA0C|nr:katanin p80 WD40 repeat-containing subunit B1 homolog isoform X2 [Helianthus annuus]
MAKRGYKLQEFVAHTANVNCLKIGKKTRRNFITGGDDEKVNLWSIGKPTATTSLSGHTSPIESVAFDSAEVLVAAGASSGVIKLWDLEETKVVRTLNGHRSYCTALEFHPFGEFFASGSMDTNLKLWDIRKKGCIHTYKGHRRAVSTIRFSPDGRWVVSGGLDNVVKIWDLTAGKLLHEFKFHEGHIRSMDFHPLEFLLATGSSDKTVKFWDLETFELIGSTRPEATGVRSVTFHPDGRTLFCGLDGSLKVYSWEPVICHDALDMGWSTLGDLCIDDGKLLGCSYYQNSVAVWVADTSLIEPHAHSILAEEKTRVQSKLNLQQDVKDRVGSPRRPTVSPDDDTKDIKNIYVDSMTPVASRKSGSLPTVLNPNPQIHKEIDNAATHKQVPAAKFTASKELTTNEHENTAVSLKPVHRRRPSTTKLDIEGISITVESGLKSGSDTATLSNFQKRIVADAAVKDSSNDKPSISVTKEIQKASSPDTLPQETRDRSDESKKESKPVKYVNGVAVVHGRTRSLVERFEKREKLNTDETQVIDPAAQVSTDTDVPPKRVNQSYNAAPCVVPEAKSVQMPVKTPDVIASEEPEAKTPNVPVRVNQSFNVVPRAIPDAVASEEPEAKTPKTSIRATDDVDNVMPEKTPDVVSNEAKSSPMITKPDVGPNIKSEEANSPPVRPRTAPSMLLPEKGKVSPMQRSVNSRRVMQERVRPSPMLVTRRSNASPRMIPERTTKTSPVVVGPRHDTPSRMMLQKAKSSPSLDDGPQTTGRGLMSKKDDDVADDLLQNHDVFVSSLRARLTKLQVVRHFWGQNDTKGAINALRKLPDHAPTVFQVQADVVNVLMERMESLTLDHFSSLLPVLLDLLDSKTERHISVSLELLLKLVAVFGSVISSTISAPPTVGVDVHAEKRLERCNECHIQLQKIRKCLPDIIRRGGLPARCAQELNIVLQKS